MTNADIEILYPNIGKRIKAVIVDYALFIIVLVSIIPFLAKIEIDYIWLKIIILLSPFFILDPLLVSLTGGSIGHHAMKIRIRDVNKDQNINIIFASIRFILKNLLGLLSLILILFTKKHQAFHDLAIKSIVVMKNSDQLDSEGWLKERSFEEEGYLYPSKVRRLIVIIIYNLIFFIFFVIIFGLLLSEPCIEIDECNQKDEIISSIIGISWFIASIFIIYKGIRARLIGCKRKKINSI